MDIKATAARMYGVLAMALMLGGCDSGKPSEEDIINRTRAWLSREIARVEALEDGDLGIRDKKYLLEQYRRTEAFLRSRQDLKRPHVVAACLLFPAEDGGEGTQGALTIEWVEHRSHVLGVILACNKPKGRLLFKIPMFADEEWGQSELANRRARTAWWARCKMVLPASSTKPALRIAPLGGRGMHGSVLELPREMASHPLEITVYDIDGPGSNFVEVNVQMGEFRGSSGDPHNRPRVKGVLPRGSFP
jgi:hypothetical protein